MLHSATCWSLFLIKFQALSLATLSVRYSNTGVLLRNLGHLQTTASILKNFAIVRGNLLCYGLFLVRLQTWRPAYLLKRNSKTGVFHRWLLLKFCIEQDNSEIKDLSTLWKLKRPCKILQIFYGKYITKWFSQIGSGKFS